MAEHENSFFFVAVVVYEAFIDIPKEDSLFQECFILVTSSSLESAREKIEELAKQEETSYQNENGETVTWVMRHIVDVNYLLEDDFHDGATLYARHFHDYEAYCKFEMLLSDN